MLQKRDTIRKSSWLWWVYKNDSKRTAVVSYLTVSRSWSSSVSVTKSVLLMIVRSARAICLEKKKERSTNKLLAVLHAFVWVWEKKKKCKQYTKDQSHRIAFHTLYYRLQIPYSLIYAKDCLCLCVCVCLEA